MQSKYWKISIKRSLKVRFPGYDPNCTDFVLCLHFPECISSLQIGIVQHNNLHIPFYPLIELSENLFKLLPTPSVNVRLAQLAVPSVVSWLILEEVVFCFVFDFCFCLFCCYLYFYHYFIYLFFHSTLFVDTHVTVTALKELRITLCSVKAVKGRLALQWKHSRNMDKPEVNFTILRQLNTD